MLTRTPFIFLRHGQTDWNAEDRCQGQMDIPLNATGRAQAEEATLPLKDCALTTICCSPLGRARETAEIVNRERQLPLVIVEDLQECAFGELEGKIEDGWTERWLEGHTPWGGESREAFDARALAGINQALRQPGPVLVVAHGGIYWSLQDHARLARDGNIANASPVRLSPAEDGGWEELLPG